MATPTLKRSLDFEALSQKPTKKRRCNSFGHSSKTSPTNTSFSNNIEQQHFTSNLQRPYRRMNDQSSPWAQTSLVNVSPDKMVQNIRDKIKRLHRHKQLMCSVSVLEHMQDSESSVSEMGPDTLPSTIGNSENALFTFKQVQLICERMLKERTDALHEQYDAVLTTKLAEQYDAFVKFTYDQIERRLETAASYLS